MSVKLLIINPWAVNNDMYYAKGMINSLARKTELDFVTNEYYEDSGNNYGLYRFFFKYSENMPRRNFRLFIRGAEYVFAYCKIIRLAKKNRYDIVHIHWLLHYKIDYFFLKILKKYCNKLILTAHNVLPHINGNLYINDLQKIYGCFDTILVHGNSIKEELLKDFPEYSEKVHLQYHGVYFEQETYFNKNGVCNELINKVMQYNKRIIMFGAMFYNKGTDRLAKIWLDKFQHSNTLLIIVGKETGNYQELDALKDIINITDNIYFKDEFIDNNTLNFLISYSDCVIVPYRHASMSGVVFTAAEFKKTVICTNVGALPEYIENNIDGFICDNTENGICDAIEIFSEQSVDELKIKGEALNRNIHLKYSWDCIADRLLNEIYI